ncbi:MAG: prolyl oligopeptidase family serine peptidase [Myxococcota bacterium]
MHTPRDDRQHEAGREDAAGSGAKREIGLKREAPFGSWPSPIDSEALVSGARVLSAPRIEAGRLFWVERRPAEAGRQVVMACALAPLGEAAAPDPFAALQEVTPAGVNVRTRVHEYGGGEYAVWRDRIFYVDDGEGRIAGGRIGGAMRPVSPTGSRFADLVVSPDGRWLIAVEERARAGAEPENRLIAIALGREGAAAGAAEPPRVIASGHDFYASPVFDAAGRRLAFLAWDHPHMPWQETVLEQMAWGASGPAGSVRRIAGGGGESLFQPGFAPDGSLLVVSDRSGWWNLARVGDMGLQPVHTAPCELGRPQWVFGLSTWACLDASRVLASATRSGRDALGLLSLGSGAWQEEATGFVAVSGIAAGDGFAACLAGTPTRPVALYAWSLAGGSRCVVRDAGLPDFAGATTSEAEALERTLPDGRPTRAFFYPPCSPTHAGPKGARPPLLVKSHGGPTSATSAAFDPRVQFWTSRGFAVADVNYTGSSGYGRAYRDGLERAWGVIDVADCVGVARWLAEANRVDAGRLAITGGSAGGFTTLCALTFHDVFHAGASHYGIGDLEALVRDTHKFESHYTDWLVGVWPEEKARYVERSPIHHADRLRCPVIFFQGLEDRVVPPNQAEAMVAALARRGIAYAYVPFPGEGHGFRRAENIRTALDGELFFYGCVFGFEAPPPPGVDWVGPSAR